MKCFGLTYSASVSWEPLLTDKIQESHNSLVGETWEPDAMTIQQCDSPTNQSTGIRNNLGGTTAMQIDILMAEYNGKKALFSIHQ